MNNKKRKYIPPQARNLSGGGAVGQQPQGACVSGPRPYFACTTGSGFVGACTVGDLPDTSQCVVGGYHTVAACDSGQSAVTVCLSGSAQNF